MMKLRNPSDKPKTGESSRSQTTRNRIAIAGVAGLALLSAVCVRAEVKADAKYQAKTKRENAAVTAEIREDGFGAENIYWVNTDEALVSLGLENCELDMVYATVDRSPDDSITEVRDYSVKGYALPVIKKGYRPSGPAGNRELTYTDGIATILKFDSLPDLKRNILGTAPCKTLAGNFSAGQNSSETGH